MAISPAKLAANRANARKSTGPKTPEGKAISRGNAIKHGLTGQGVALPSEDAGAVAARFDELRDQYAPQTQAGAILVKRIAMLSVRLDRCARYEHACTAVRIIKARTAADEHRLAEAESLLHWIRSAPATNVRLLKKTPEGLDLLIGEWQKLLAELSHPRGCRWDYPHYQRAETLHGLDASGAVRTSYHDFTHAMKGRFDYLAPHEGEGLSPQERAEWAFERLIEKVEGDIADLKALRAGFDMAGIEAERAFAADLALFDPGPEATLARKYEAATERGLYKAINELREVEAEALGSIEQAEEDESTLEPGPPRPLPRRSIGPDLKQIETPQTSQSANLDRPNRASGDESISQR